jgi:hypothetical protein
MTRLIMVPGRLVVTPVSLEYGESPVLLYALIL